MATVRALLAAALALGLAACGSGGASTTTVSGGSGTGTPDVTSAATTAETATSTSSTGSAPGGTPAGGGPTIRLVWAVTDASGAVTIRVAVPGGGAAHTLTTLPAGDMVVALGHGVVLVSTADHHLVSVDVATGTRHTHPAGTGLLFGAAFDDAGARVAFVDAVDPTTIHFDILDLAADHVTQVAALPNRFVVPTHWSGTTIAGPVIIGFAGAGQQGVRTVSAATGAQLAQSTVPGVGGYLALSDVVHAAATSHSALGDDADVAPGPIPEGPFNTLTAITIGGATHQLLSEAHHTLSVLAGTPDGGTLLVVDNSAAGGFAGISMSSDFGLFLVRGSAKTQLAHIGAERVAGTLLQDGSTAVVAEKSASGLVLVQYGTSGGPVNLDTVAGGQQAVVGLVPSG